MHTIKKFFLGSIAALAAAGFGAVCHAASAVASMGVSATVMTGCIAFATPVAFGNYTLAANDSAAVISVSCSSDVNHYTVALGKGTGAGSSTSSRKMTSAITAEPLAYSLYRDAGRTQPWGDTPGTDTQAASAATSTTGSVRTFTVYARIPASQSASIGTYSDVVQVTVNY